jgi:integrase/recombinase XerD
VTLLLSVKAGLRAKEIANLTWDMVMTSDGEKPYIHLTNEASKGKTGGRVVPLNRELRSALSDLSRVSSRGRPSPFVITTERATKTSPQAIVNLFSRWYEELGFHSGRHNLMPPALPRAPA